MNMIDNQGETPLYHGVMLDNEMIVVQLLRTGANINTTDDHMRTALPLAVEYSYTSMAQDLVKHRAEIEEKNKEKNKRCTSVYVAASGDQIRKREIGATIVRKRSKCCQERLERMDGATFGRHFQA